MTQVEKEDIRRIVKILIQLDKTSLLLIQNGAELLKARQEMDKPPEPKKTA